MSSPRRFLLRFFFRLSRAEMLQTKVTGEAVGGRQSPPTKHGSSGSGRGPASGGLELPYGSQKFNLLRSEVPDGGVDGRRSQPTGHGGGVNGMGLISGDRVLSSGDLELDFVRSKLSILQSSASDCGAAFTAGGMDALMEEGGCRHESFHGSFDGLADPIQPLFGDHVLAGIFCAGAESMRVDRVIVSDDASRLPNSSLPPPSAFGTGSVKSLINLSCFMSHASILATDREARGLTEDLIRISVGIEDVDDLITNIDYAIRSGLA